MRGLLFAAAVASVLVAAPTGATFAQGRERETASALPPSMQSVAQTSITRFRTRADNDRRRLLRTLDVIAFSEVLPPSFSLTPRQPYVAGRGALSTGFTDFDAHFDTTGLHIGDAQDSSLNLDLVGLNNNRMLIDCAISGADGAAFNMFIGQIGQEVVAQNGRVSFVTHPIAQSAKIYVSIDLSPSTSSLNWVFTGCELTPLPPA